MKTTAPKTQRCAIYTRKSTEHNLDLAFNSLDAQREACEAYIKSQAHEGWKLIPTQFNDGGLSGASLERPALQALLDEVKAKKIDIIVVYKVDRLTRSLADFAKLVELFDEHEVSFVSVTQSFNTTSSMGRLTLNVLLSFAQFEREVIGERVRDKIAASKRKGIWVGGPVPLGYRSRDKKLEIVQEEADLVRKIFYDYLRIGSIGALAASLNAEGLKPKPRVLAERKAIAAECFRVGPLAHLLKNRFYIGEVAYRGEIHKGAHEPILDRELFDAVQCKLAEQKVERKLRGSGSPFLLTSLLFDDRGNRMTPSHANKKGVRYRYYVSQAVLQSRKEMAGSVTRVAAPDVEALVLTSIGEQLAALTSGGQKQTDIPDSEGTAEAGGLSDRDLLLQRVDRIVVLKDRLRITFKEGVDLDPISIPFTASQPLRKGIVNNSSGAITIDAKTREVLLLAIGRSHYWLEQIMSGSKHSLDDIAEKEHLAERHVRRLMQLAFLSPKIIEAIESGTAPAGLTVSQLTQSLPMAWTQQEEMVGLS